MTQFLARSESNQSLDSLRKVIYEIQGANDINRISEVVSQYIQQKLGFEFSWLGLYDSRTETLNGPWRFVNQTKIQTTSISILPGDLFDQVLLTRHAATVPSLQEESRVGAWQENAKKIKLQGAVLQTLRFQKESLGVILIGTRKWGVNPRQEDSEELAIIANTVGTALKLLETQKRGNHHQAALPEYDDQPLVDLLSLVGQCQSWEEQLTTIVNEIIDAHPNLSCGLYLLDPDTGDFESYHIHQPNQEQRSQRSKNTPHKLPYHQNSSFFRSLERQPYLAISDIHSMVGVTVPTNLMSHLQARSLLIQPIMVGQGLKGIWVMSHPEPRSWGEVEKRTLTLMTKLVELTYPTPSRLGASIEIDESQGIDQLSPLPSAQSTIDEWSKGLNQWLIALTKKFQCQWGMLLSFDEPSQEFLVTQIFSTNRRTKIEKHTAFGALSQVDQKLLTRSDQAVALIDLKEDVRLVAWRDRLLAEGMQSILLTHCASGENLQDVLILGNTTARFWTPDDASDLWHYGEQFHHAQTQRQQYHQMLQEQDLHQIFRQGLQTLLSTKSTQTFVEQAAHTLVDLVHCSGCLILLGAPSRDYLKVKAIMQKDADLFETQFGQKVSCQDPLIYRITQAAQTLDHCLTPIQIKTHELMPDTQDWLSLASGTAVLGLPLQPQPKQSIFGTILLVQPENHQFSDLEKETLSDFSRYMAWVLCSSHVTDSWRRDYQGLHTLHWHRNRVLGQACEAMMAQIDQINQAASSDTIREGSAQLHGLVQGIYEQNTQLMPEIQPHFESITLVRLLREITDRLEPVFSAKQVWVQVHHLKQSNLAIKTSQQHITFIFDEVLKAATARSEAGGRIDIWCRMNQPEWLEISITDGGQLDPRFIRDLHLGHHRDRLKSSPVSEDLGQRLLACKSLTQKLGGKLDVMPMDDGRTLTRFTLPCITS